MTSDPYQPLDLGRPVQRGRRASRRRSRVTRRPAAVPRPAVSHWRWEPGIHRLRTGLNPAAARDSHSCRGILGHRRAPPARLTAQAGWADRRDRCRVRLPIWRTGASTASRSVSASRSLTWPRLASSRSWRWPTRRMGCRSRWAGRMVGCRPPPDRSQPGLGAGVLPVVLARTRLPEVAIESLEIVPLGHRFLVAAVTLGLSDEAPFVRDGAVPVRVDLKSPELAARPARGRSVQPPDRGRPRHRQLRLSAARALRGRVPDRRVRRLGRAAERGVQPAPMPRSPRSRRRPSPSSSARRRSTRCAGATCSRTARSRPSACASRSSRTAATGSRRSSSTTRPASRCRAASTSARRDGVPYQPHGHHGHVNSNLDTWHIDVGGDLRLGQITLRLYRRPLPGLAAARRGAGRRRARLRVRAAAPARHDRARPAPARAAAQALDEHERSSAGSAATPTCTSCRPRAACARRRPRT